MTGVTLRAKESDRPKPDLMASRIQVLVSMRRTTWCASAIVLSDCSASIFSARFVPWYHRRIPIPPGHRLDGV